MLFHSTARVSRATCLSRLRRLAVVALVPAAVAVTPGTSMAATGARTWFVAPSGSGSACAGNSKSTPFATIQAALACAGDGDVISLAPSGSTPYPGVGAVSHSVTIKAAGSANARSVVVDLGQPLDASGNTQGLMTVPSSASVQVQGVTLECVAGSAASTPCVSDGLSSGSLVTNNGTLALTGVTLTGAEQGAAINNISTGSTPARLTVTDSTIAHNTNAGFSSDLSLAAGINSVKSGGAPDPQVTVVNSTIADNSDARSGGAGAIYTDADQAGAVTLIADTITANQGLLTGGVFTAVDTPVVQLSNTVIAGNTVATGPGSADDPDCNGPVADGSGGHNLLGNDTGCTGLTNNTNGDLVGVSNPALAALGNNGGGTDTVALQPQSPAIGAGDLDTCKDAPVSGKDQRGDARSVTTHGCDIGAYDTDGSGGLASHTWFVAPSGSGSACAANSKSTPFGTIQAALACAGDGDVISLAPSGSTPYPGVGTVSHSVTIKAAGSGNARSVVVDLGQPLDAAGYTQGLMTVPSSASVSVQGVTLECAAGSASTDCIAGNYAAGSLVTNHGTLALTGVTVTGARHGAAINNISTGSTPARLTVTDSTIAHNTNDGLAGDLSSAAGISSIESGDAPDPQVTVVNSTIADNSDTGGAESGSAGAIYTGAVTPGAVTLIGDTITANQGSASGGVYAAVTRTAVPSVQLSNTVIAGNTASISSGGPDCDTPLADGPGGHNLLGNDTGCTGLTNNTNGDQVGSNASPIDPQLAPVAYDGGSTETAPPLTGSPAIGTGSATTCEDGPLFDRDERGDLRHAVTRGGCDIGADDTGGSTPAQTGPAITSKASAKATVGTRLTFKVTATGTPKAAIAESGSLPSGVSLTDNGNGTATLAGKPAAGTAGSYPITITAQNGFGSAVTQAFTLTVAK